jgi:D-alanine-D-alanine ligase
MTKKIRVGILFGGASREREISFMGGRTAFVNMDRRYFEPIPIFVDSLNHFIKINPELIYSESIRDFYPTRNLNKGYKIYIESLGQLSESQIYKFIYRIGSQIKVEDLSSEIDFAFSIMHGPYAEDGSIQGLLEWFNIPYMGPGLLGSAIGINKAFQNDLLAQATAQTKKYFTIPKRKWKNTSINDLYDEIIAKVGFPFVVKAPHQGSSIGVAIVKKRSTEELQKALSQCFFEQTVQSKEWYKLSERKKKNFAQKVANLDEGIGYPVFSSGQFIYHPDDLIQFLDKALLNQDFCKIAAANGEDFVLIEEFIVGQEFSCGVIEDDSGKAIALPPAEVYGEIQTFDFKSKYQSSVSKKRIPVLTSDANLDQIHDKILKGFKSTGMSVIARIDGFLTVEDEVILHDPNTIPGMSPASFIFKQMAEVGFNICESITYFIRQSIRERIKSGKNIHVLEQMLASLDSALIYAQSNPKPKVALVFGENEAEFSALKQKYNELSASLDADPVAICHAKNGNKYQIPMNLLFKPDIQEFGAAVGQPKHAFIQKNIESTKEIREKIVGQVEFGIKLVSEVQLEQDFSKTIYISNLL